MTENGDMGKHIKIQHDQGYITYYCKLSEILCLPGEQVKAGEVIACSGNTGLSTGPHLHFSIFKNGKPLDPELYIKFE